MGDGGTGLGGPLHGVENIERCKSVKREQREQPNRSRPVYWKYSNFVLLIIQLFYQTLVYSLPALVMYIECSYNGMQNSVLTCTSSYRLIYS